MRQRAPDQGSTLVGMNSMDWAPEFYDLQQRLGDVYSGPVLAHHRTDAAELVARLKHGDQLLELGAGGGQCALALAELGCQVTAIEYQPSAVAHAQALLDSAAPAGSLTLHAADFYTLQLVGTFDAVCYWDGFGIGTDADQRRLLRRIRDWLNPGGVVLMDIFTPWYWAEVAGARHEGTDAQGSGWVREYAFDGQGSRMLDTWWAQSAPERRLTQSLRCYSPAGLELLLEGTGLRLDEVVSGGRFDQGSRMYTQHAPLRRAMTYRAWLSAC
jgi:SAM-dependent methyltransferase